MRNNRSTGRATPPSTMDGSRRSERALAYAFGVIFILVMLALAMLIPEPSKFQFIVFKVVLALAAAGVAAMVPGFLEFRVSTYLRAGGALAVFAIVFFKSPEGLITKQLDKDFIDLSTDSEKPLSAIVDAVKRQQNITVVFGANCSPAIPKTALEQGDFQGKNVQDFLEKLKQRAKGEEPAYHVTKNGDRRYEIACP